MTNRSRRDNQSCTSSHGERTRSRLRTWRESSTFQTAEAKNASHPTISGMEPQEEQFDPKVKAAYFDLDAPDMSEQEFAASLEAEIDPPKFEVDPDEPTVLESAPAPNTIVGGRTSRPSDEDMPTSCAGDTALSTP